MEKLTIEEKAKRYDEVAKKVRDFFEGKQKMRSDITKALENLFPELKELEDEKIRKEILDYIDKATRYERWIAWLKKQEKPDKTHYDIAEKEKYDFVSGQYIECRKSFDVFKEENSYWFEYVGNDNYIGRSDNILNQKFHITPKQLYCLFTQQHCPKEDWLENTYENKSCGIDTENDGKFECPNIKINDAIEVSSRMKYIDDELKPIAEFILEYADWNLNKDEWNQPTITVPVFRVLDALINKGKPYKCS